MLIGFTTQRSNAVNHEKRGVIRCINGFSDGLNVISHRGRRVYLDDHHRSDFFGHIGFEALFKRLGIHGIRITSGQDLCLNSRNFSHLSPPNSERAGLKNKYFVSSRKRVADSHFPCTMSIGNTDKYWPFSPRYFS